MRVRRSLVILLVLGSASVPLTACSSCQDDAPTPVEARPTEPPTLAVQSFRLDNGLDVELVSGDCGERVAVALLFEVGADHDPVGRSGASEIIARLFAEDDAQVHAGRDHTSCAVSVPRDRLESTLGALAQRMASLGADDDAVARARAAVIEGAAARHGGDAALTAASFAAESVLPSLEQGFRGGIAVELEGLDRAAIDALWHASWTAANARLVVVGDFDTAAVRAQVTSAFGPLPEGSAPTPREPTEASVRGTIVMGDAPSALAIAVRAPAPGDALHPAFLMLAARLVRTTDAPWQAHYDPIAEPGVLLVSGAMQIAEPPETGAIRIRNAIAAVLDAPLAPADVDRTRETYTPWLGHGELDPTSCSGDPQALALARARRAQLELRGATLDDALAQVTEAQLADARALFVAQSAAVAGGGAIR